MLLLRQLCSLTQFKLVFIRIQSRFEGEGGDLYTNREDVMIMVEEEEAVEEEEEGIQMGRSSRQLRCREGQTPEERVDSPISTLR